MKKIIYILIVGFLSFGCSDFLDTTNYTKKDTSNFPMTVTDADQMLAGIYNALNLEHTDYNVSQFMLAELSSDDRFGGGGEDDKLWQAVDKYMNYGTSMVGMYWKHRYEGIFRANNAIETMDNCKGWTSEEQRNQYMGEAYFMRAYYYFTLAQVFGEVPLVVTTAPVNLPKSPAAEVYAQVASDLKKSIELMWNKPYTSLTSGHATKWAAEALMARVFLFYTGYYQQASLPALEGGTITKDQVITWLDDCINNSGHALVSDFRNIWPYSNQWTKNAANPDKGYKYSLDNKLSWEGDGCKETLFAIKFSNMGDWDTNTTLTGFANQCVLAFGVRGSNGYESTFPFGVGWGAGPVNRNFWTEWHNAEPNDIRRAGSIIDVDAEIPGYTEGGDAQMEECKYFEKKYTPIRSWDGDNLRFTYGVQAFGFPRTDDYQLCHNQDIILIRFADVLLMQSELKQDAAGLNKVRARAGLPAVAYSIDALKKERHWELAFEGLRIYDLMRWGDAADALAKQEGVSIKNRGQDAVMKAFGGGYKARYQATGGFWPIPETQISLSAGVLVQNKGWGSADANFVSW